MCIQIETWQAPDQQGAGFGGQGDLLRLHSKLRSSLARMGDNPCQPETLVGWKALMV